LKVTGTLRTRLQRTPPGYEYSIGRILAIYAGLMVAIFLASLDQTIVATALPRIASDLGGLGQYSWVFTAYLLAATITVPIYGKLGDIYGRRPVILGAITIFVTGSALCGLAQNMTELVLFRGLQGLGAGGLIPLALATIGTVVPPRDRGKYQGLIGATFGASSIMGPAIGGLIVDNMSWRWIFYVNVPVGGLALLTVAATMPKQKERIQRSIDWLGAGLLAVGTASVLLALIWGGKTYPWGSPQVIGALLLGLAFLGVFALVERRTKETILPFRLLRQPIIASGAASMGLVAMVMFGTIAFTPLFVQGVIGTNATSSGVVLTPLMLGAVITSILAGQWVSRTGKYRLNALLGPIVLGAGMFLLWNMNTSTTTAQAARNMVVAGIGMGLMMQVFVLAVQNSVERPVIGSATALLQFCRSIGTTFGVTIFGVIVNQNLPKEARGGGPVIHRLTEQGRDQLAAAIHPAYVLGMAICAVVWLIVFFGIEERPLRKTFDEPATVGAAPASAGPSRADSAVAGEPNG
jgi:EmrB/QacA subfamily drug resistance transporter